MTSQSSGKCKRIKRSPAQQTEQPCQKQPKNDDMPTTFYTLEELLTVNLDFPSRSIHGVKILPDGRMLLTDFQRILLLVYDNRGNLKQEIKLPGKPVDVTLISDTEAAVSYWSPNGIAVVDINTMTVRQQNIMKSTDIRVCGVTSDGIKLVATYHDRILVMDVTGSILKEIKTNYTDGQRYISFVSKTRLCFSNTNPHSVQCIDIDGTEIFTYQPENLQWPYGITCDEEGMIYVTGWSSHNVHKISPEGKLLNIILSKTNGIENPLAINYSFKTKKLTLTHSNKSLTVYQVK